MATGLRFFIKPDASVDAYISWSSMHSAPTGWGSRENMIELYRRESGDAGKQRAVEALDEADEKGSSSQDGTGIWDDPVLVLRNTPVGDGTVRREDLVKLMDAYATCTTQDGLTAAIGPLITPLERD